MSIFWLLVILAVGIWFGWRARSADYRNVRMVAAHRRDVAVNDAADCLEQFEDLGNRTT